MIFDADLTMPPEQLPKFWEAIASHKGEFINGSRLIYPMEAEAMRFLNLIANKMFSLLFTGSSASGSPIRCAAPRFCADPTTCVSKQDAAISATSIRSATSI